MNKMSPSRPARDADAMDRAAGLNPRGAIFAARAGRPEFVDGAEACRVAVLSPQDDLGLSLPLRQAIARRAALSSGNPRLIAGYPAPDDAALSALAEGDTPTTPREAALARHTDLIAHEPGRSTAQDLEQLQEAGLSVAQVIAVSELLAYVCFEVRVAHGLALLEDAS
ncbi:MAG: esterase [Celeribacter sp.]|jgi:uncharacterized protein YciW